MKKIVMNVATLVAAIIGFVMAVEEEGNGAEKKKKVIELMIDFVENYGADKLPSWLRGLFTSETFLSAMIEALVWKLKRVDFLG